VQKVDEAARQIIFSAGGMNAGKDPYFLNYYRINFDGSGLTPLTTGDGNHNVVFSEDGNLYVDTWSRVDAPPIAELHKTADASLVMPLEKGDIADLQAAGWKPPEVFVAKARDGTTDIWGVIYRPTGFSAARKYPVIENIYADRRDRSCRSPSARTTGMQAIAELGFIVVQIDGMGTSNRSKAFHDVAWKNLGDAGFPDRILWHKAVAAKYPYYDITASASTAHRRAARTRSARCSSTATSTRPPCRPRAATTTGWTRSGGTSSGWDGRSARSTPPRRTSTTRRT
jgi:hypothetical protein